MGQPKARAELTSGQVPAGAKSVTRTTQEKFIEPIDQPDDNETEETAILGNDELDEFEEIETQEPVSRVQAFISSLKEGAGDGTIRIYAIRKPDPPGIEFRNTCNQEYTAGDVPFDESDLSVEALEVGIQKLYGGGRYQIKVRQNGNYAGAITRNIRDLPEQQTANQANSSHLQPPAPVAVEPRRTAREELDDILDVAERLATIKSANQPGRSLSPFDNDPFKAADASFELLTKAKTLFGDRDEGGASSSGGERHWSEGVLTGTARVFESLGLREIVKEGVTLFRAVRAQAERDAAQQGTGAATPPSGPDQAATALPNPPPVEQPPPPQTSAAPSVSPKAMKVLETVVAEIRAYDSDEDNSLLDERAARAAAAVRTLPLETLTMLNEVPPAFMLPALVGLNGEWADLAHMQESNLFIHSMLLELQKEPDGQGTTEPAQAAEAK